EAAPQLLARPGLAPDDQPRARLARALDGDRGAESRDQTLSGEGKRREDTGLKEIRDADMQMVDRNLVSGPYVRASAGPRDNSVHSRNLRVKNISCSAGRRLALPVFGSHLVIRGFARRSATAGVALRRTRFPQDRSNGASRAGSR